MNKICLILLLKKILKMQHTSDFAKKTDLAILKPDVDELDINKLKIWQIIEPIWKVNQIN